jgi:hypothetical protein
MSSPPSYVSLADFASTFHDGAEQAPAWVHPGAGEPRILASLGLGDRLEDVLDTVIALQKAEWLHDGVYAGPGAMPVVYRDVLHCARELRVAVPPAIVAGSPLRIQGCYGTDDRAFLYLSTFFFDAASTAERRFLAGRFCGHIAAHQVTVSTLYALLVDQNGLRAVARRGVGPLLEIVLGPISLAVRLALSRWHRAAEITADRAGLLCSRDLEGAGRAMLRMSLGRTPDLDVATYLSTLRASTGESAPGKWTELLRAEPFTHKRLEALALFAGSALWAELTGESVVNPIPNDELATRTSRLLGVN